MGKDYAIYRANGELDRSPAMDDAEIKAAIDMADEFYEEPNCPGGGTHHIDAMVEVAKQLMAKVAGLEGAIKQDGFAVAPCLRCKKPALIVDGGELEVCIACNTALDGEGE